MSTTFEVYAKDSRIPSFTEVFDLSMKNINRFLSLHDIAVNISIECELRSQSDADTLQIDKHSPFSWSDDYYLWITVKDVSGGIDVYMDDVEESYIEELYEKADTAEKLQCIKESVKQNYTWRFRRSSGQPAIINIAYGFIAGSLAKLTDGIVYSGDCAWSPSMLPAKGENFLMFYMEPEKTADKEYRQLALECIASLRNK